MSMIPAFNISLNNPILQGLVAVGKFDGVHAALACGTATDHVVVHSPYASRELVSAAASSSDDVIAANATDLKHLSVNQRVTALATGDLHQDPPLGSLLYEDLDDDNSGYGRSAKPKKPDHRDVLLVGMQTNLLAYDVEENTDVFYKDVPDGVSAVACGRMSAASPPVAITGGHCSLQGFDRTGNEVFWTVAGDNISALTFRDLPIALVGAGGTVNVPGTATLSSSAPPRAQQLIVASEDYEIRIYEQNDVVIQANETDVVSALTPIRGSLFGYGLRNGTIGVYDNGQRLWSTKSKHAITALTSFDLDGDGIPELISGWNNGKIEARSDRSSQVIYKDRFSAPIAGIVSADYRTDGKTELICCTTDGQIRGYLTVGEETKAAVISDTVNERILAELNAAKQDLMTELRGYENNLKEFKVGKLGAGVVPPDTRLNVSLQPSAQLGALVLALATNNDTLIKVVMIFNDTIFEDESLLVHPAKPSSACSVLIRPLKQVDTVLNIKVVVGHRSSTQDHVFEVTQRLPRFACYVDTPLRDLPVPRSKVTCALSERSSRVANWVQNSFLVEEKTLGAATTGDTLSFGFVGVFDRAPVVLRFSGGQFEICTDSMDLAGDILQDLASFLNIPDLQSVADFPDEFDAFAETLRCVEEFNAVRIKMSGEMADSSNLVKSLVIKAEDARMLNHMPQMRGAYNELSEMNANLIGEYTKRANNHQQLLASLKDVNKMIQKAAKLRVGRHKTAVVTACRAAVKGNNMQSLFKIIRVGQSTA